MARYKLLETAHVKRTPDAAFAEVLNADTEIEMADDAIPGPHMEPLDKAARIAMELYLKQGAPLDEKKVRAINAGLIVPVPGAYVPAEAFDLKQGMKPEDLVRAMQQVFGPMFAAAMNFQPAPSAATA